ncbi:hypothetical protein [Methanospirillum hungatei]|uniref:hypothetical protein n=1 Tax=Methanospirillum hungatei TaxID=2203 RepID=UPI0026EDAB38|nr:hypothetical protein [Methanospirillum hungatei]MCA1917602.1 hypothetical protein [Methanospirillum hungatei]
MQIKAEELKKIVLMSYELTVLMPKPIVKDDKFVIESRSKFKTLPESLHQMEDAAASVTHFVKSAAYFLPRKDAGTKPEQMLPFMNKLMEHVNELNRSGGEPERVRELLKYLIGYANWNADAICAILTAMGEAKSSDTIRNMLEAELKVVGADHDVDRVFSQIQKWIRDEGGYHQKANQHFQNNQNMGINNQRRRY